MREVKTIGEKTFDEVVRDLVRRAVDSYVDGVPIRSRMEHIVNYVEAWQYTRPAPTHSIGSYDAETRDDLISDLVETDLDSLVAGEKVKTRVYRLAQYAHLWVHDQRLKAIKAEAA